MGRVAFRGQVDHCTRNFTWCLLNTINQLLISRLDVFSSCSEGSTTAQQHNSTAVLPYFFTVNT